MEDLYENCLNSLSLSTLTDLTNELNGGIHDMQSIPCFSTQEGLSNG